MKKKPERVPKSGGKALGFGAPTDAAERTRQAQQRERAAYRPVIEFQETSDEHGPAWWADRSRPRTSRVAFELDEVQRFEL